MPGLSPITFHTATPESTPAEYVGGVFRDVVGIEQGNQALWLPGAASTQIEPMTFNLPRAMGANVMAYFKQCYIRNPTVYRNCYIGAVAITSGEIVGWADAKQRADHIVYAGEDMEVVTLGVGAHGAYGNRRSRVGAFHSVVGLTTELALQTFNEYAPALNMFAPLNIASHVHNLAHYRVTDPHLSRGFYSRLI